MEKQTTGHNRAFMQKVLSPEEFDALRPRILEIPGFTHKEVRAVVNFPMWPPHEVVKRLPQELMKRCKQRLLDGRLEENGLDWRISRLESKQTLRAGVFNTQFIDAIAPSLSHKFTQFDFVFVIDFFPLMSKELGVIAMSMKLGSYGGKEAFELSWRPSEGAVQTGRKDEGLNTLYQNAVRSFMSHVLVGLKMPGCTVSDWIISSEMNPESLDLGRCWDSVSRMEWVTEALSKASVSCYSALEPDLDWDYSPEIYDKWATMLESIYQKSEHCEGAFGFVWYGFPEVEPDWLEMGSLVARLTSKCGPIPIRLGDILVPPKGLSRGQLSVIRIDEGVILSVKGGGSKLLTLLSNHFGVPWLQGISPVPIQKRLIWTSTPPPPEMKPPVIFKKAPPFFKKAASKNGASDDLASEKFLKMLEQSGMFEGYDAETRKLAEEMIDASYRPEGDWQTQLISAIGFWRDSDDASGYLEEVIAALHESSFGIFSPVDLKIEFDDEEMPPEGDVHISFMLNSKFYKLTAEYFHGSIPGELLPFVRESMEKSCHGVAWRQIFPKAKDTKALYYTLCTASALEQIKVNAAAIG